MIRSEFFPSHDGVRLVDLAASLSLRLTDETMAERVVKTVSPVYRATHGDLCYILNRKNRAELETCRASAIICDDSMASFVPGHVAVLIARNPHVAFARAGKMLHPQAMQPLPNASRQGIHPLAHVDPSVHFEANVTVEPFAVIGEGAWIGENTTIGAGAVIGNHVKIGRDCTIASGTSVICAYIGNDVIIHNGARIGQDGFGYAPGAAGMEKIVQVGRVIIQDKVEIGANTTIDRGTMDDTIIGEGTKIDNGVQIGHNVRIGRHCGIVAQVGIAGSTQIGDGVLIGGASGINGHITIGDGVQIAAMSGVVANVPAGEKYGGLPARPIKDFLRSVAEQHMKDSAASKKGIQEK